MQIKCYEWNSYMLNFCKLQRCVALKNKKHELKLLKHQTNQTNIDKNVSQLNQLKKIIRAQVAPHSPAADPAQLASPQ